MSLTVTSATTHLGDSVGMEKHSMAVEKPTSKGSDDMATGINMVIRQDPFSISLDAAALLAVSIMLVLGMHTMDHRLLECLIITVPVLLLIRNDYHNFLNLGPGGTPPTPVGYARLTWYRLFALRDPFSPPPRDPTLLPSDGILRGLPYRPGPRPSVAGLAPQRQLDQFGSRPMHEKLKATLLDLTARNPKKFTTATSCLEKHGFALFARHPLNVCGNGEVCHLHTSDKSMHMNLHPDDIKEILAKGWGQRHPMAWTGWVYTPVPSTFVMVYAPRGRLSLLLGICLVD